MERKLKALRLLDCFSQNKDELILAFGDEKVTFFIRANLNANISLLQFPESFARASKNSINLFTELIDQKVKCITTFRFERSFQLMFENGDALLFKMHARRSNILHVKNDKVISLFRKDLGRDMGLIPSQLSKKTEVSKENFQAYELDPMTMIPALGKEVKIHLEKIGFRKMGESKKWRVFLSLLTMFEHNTISLIKLDTPKISLIETNDKNTRDPIVATNWLYDQTVHYFYFERERQQAIHQLKQKIRKTEKYVEKTKESLEQMENARNLEEIANILMANLNQLQTGWSEAVLPDFYHNKPITIKLNPILSPQKNAENYYRKAKNRYKEILVLEENIRVKESFIEHLNKLVPQFHEIESYKKLREFKKTHGLATDERTKEENLPYQKFEVDGWQIMMGKNSKSNDELTLKVANKNDLWLHAKDVAGAHVVIRQKSGHHFPDYIIEKAASLAAANSKRKTDSLCPVIYTQKKFVRKMKGTPTGQMIVEKEQITMVKPERL